MEHLFCGCQEAGRDVSSQELALRYTSWVSAEGERRLEAVRAEFLCMSQGNCKQYLQRSEKSQWAEDPGNRQWMIPLPPFYKSKYVLLLSDKPETRPKQTEKHHPKREVKHIALSAPSQAQNKCWELEWEWNSLVPQVQCKTDFIL